VVIKHALVGVLISISSHLVAVLALYHITYNVLQSPENIKRKVAFAASCLHIISPAGLFLSAPYGESTFAAFNFAGALCYTLSVQARLQQEGSIPNRFKPDGKVMMIVVWTLVSGLCIGLSTMMRSNGILGGLLFASDAVKAIRQPAKLFEDRRALIAFTATVCAGMLVGLGFATPQVVAYVEYCTGGNTRPWCMNIVPSIYSWVQSHYWEVGFLRYWTLNNLPLFLLAAPTLAVMLYTGALSCISHRVVPPPDATSSANNDDRSAYNKTLTDGRVYTHIIPRLAVQQLLLAFMAATSFHVQIVNRISSGYPVWYIVLASAMYNSSASRSTAESQKSRQPIPDAMAFLEKSRYLKWIVRSMVMYAVVQGGLYASFLPPA
jgi:GPI mannosyltransferase 2